jgi:hypothetical protein
MSGLIRSCQRVRSARNRFCLVGFSAAARRLATPKPLKTFGNLTKSVSAQCFNRDSQLLAIPSKEKKDQMCMVLPSSPLLSLRADRFLIHLPSLTAFANWPTASAPLGHVTLLDFLTGSEYLVVGNGRSRTVVPCTIPTSACLQLDFLNNLVDRVHQHFAIYTHPAIRPTCICP